jgi:dUTP pyrophosphatase
LKQLKVKRLPGVDLPKYATEGSVGFDLAANEELSIKPKTWAIISTGLFFEIPEGFEVQIRSRSGLASTGLIVMNQPGTLDSDYRGEVKVILLNLKTKVFKVYKGNRIAQAIMAPIARAQLVEVQELTPTSRGEKGLGSTGE